MDASNVDRFPENQSPSSVNDGARALEGILARWHKDTNASKASTGSANAYVFAADQTLTAYYDGLVIAFDANFTNTGAATLNVDSVSADPIVLLNGQALQGGEIRSGQKTWVVHDGTNWQLLNPSGSGTTLFYDDDAGSSPGPIIDTHRDSASPAASDNLAEIQFNGEDSGGNKHTYAKLRGEIVSPTDGSETGRIEIEATNGLNFFGASSGPTVQGIIIPRGYIDGFTMLNAADTAHDIRINPGMAADSGDVALIISGSNIIKQIDANWANGTNQGGFPSGLTLSADTDYQFFVIRNPSDGDVDAGFDTDLAATNLLADATGFTQYRRLGKISTDGSSNITNNQFAQVVIDGEDYDGGERATTSGTAIDFRAIPSTAKKIFISFEGVSLSGTDDLLVQLGDSGGIETTGYISSGGAYSSSGQGVSSSTSGFVWRVGNAAEIASGHMVLTLSDSTNNTWIVSHTGKNNTGTVVNGGGDKSLSGTLDRIRITRTGSDTFDAGAVNVLGE